MYQIIIYNGAEQTSIHFPTADKDAPHLLAASHKETLSTPDGLSFVIPYMNPGYSKLEGLITKIKVIDTRDESVRFVGRVLPTKEGMSGAGMITKNVTCEGAMAYLNDTSTRQWNYTNKTPTQILSDLLTKHNSKVDAPRRINLGTVQLTQPITIDTNYETTLNAMITKIHNTLGGDLVVRETGGLLYLDYLTAKGANNEVTIELGRNMKDITREYDPANLINRIAPLGYGEGINQLKILGATDYIEDTVSVAKYGVIETVWTNKEIQDLNTLTVAAQTLLDQNKQPRLIIDTSAIDLSVMSGYETDKFKYGDTLHIINPVFNLDVYARVVDQDTNLFAPWDPQLTISTRPIGLADEIVDLKQRSMSLETAPQGSTFIDTYGYAENIDATHRFQLPVWISPDILNVNRVRLHIDGQKYRAYEKGMAALAQTTETTGASSATTSGASSATSSAASNSDTTSSGGTTTSNSSSVTTVTLGDNISTMTSSKSVTNDSNYNLTTPNGAFGNHKHSTELDWDDTGYAGNQGGHQHGYDHYHGMAHWHGMPHEHNISHTHSISKHSHDMPHTHNIPHTHNMAHTHDIVIPTHGHELDYGIFEDTYPTATYVLIDGVQVAGPFGGDAAWSEDLDLTPYIKNPGSTYNLEVKSSRNGRVNVWVSIQAFIQTK